MTPNEMSDAQIDRAITTRFFPDCGNPFLTPTRSYQTLKEILSQLQRDGWAVEMSSHESPFWTVELRNGRGPGGRTIVAKGYTLPLAVCRAALMAAESRRDIDKEPAD